MLAAIKKEISSHPTFYLLLSAILLLAFFLRVYRVSDLMGFYYDQGRDALVIWKLWHEGKPFLIGPVTGLAGIFLGPAYYYLIAPFYLIGGGNPAAPAVFLSFTTVVALIPLYYLGFKMHSRLAGILAAAIGGLSFYLVEAGRWLSNPTPMFLMSVLVLWTMWEIIQRSDVRNTFVNTQGKQNASHKLWIVLAFLIGVSLQFESASAVFYIPMTIIFMGWVYFRKSRHPEFSSGSLFRKMLKQVQHDKHALFLSLLVFLITLLPQLFFNLRHENLIFNNFKRVLLAEKSFRLSFWEVFELRLSYVWTVFWSKILPIRKDIVLFFTIISFYSLFGRASKLSVGIKLLLIFIGIPIIGYFAFQGNEGNVFDYYMTGYYLPMVLLFSIGLASMWPQKVGKLLVISFFAIFAIFNFKYTKNYLTQGMEGANQIKLGTERDATDWVLENGKESGERFNVRVYVPPVIPHSYDYLLLWRGTKKCGDTLCGYEKDKTENLLYTIFENDNIHTDRLKAWKQENDSNSRLLETKVFGGVTAEKRIRIN